MSGALEPRHPAARAIHDERGTAITLGLSEAELRLECLKQALANGAAHSRAVALAEEFAAFVLGTDSPTEDGAEQPKEQASAFSKASHAQPEPAYPPPSEATRQAAEEQVTHDLQCAADYSRRSNHLLSRAFEAMKAGQATNEPARPSLSEAARRALAAERDRLLRSASQDETAARANSDRAAGAQETASSWAKAAEIQRQAAADISRDLGETSPT